MLCATDDRQQTLALASSSCDEARNRYRRREGKEANGLNHWRCAVGLSVIETPIVLVKGDCQIIRSSNLRHQPYFIFCFDAGTSVPQQLAGAIRR